MASLWNRLVLSLVLLSAAQLLLVCADYEVRVAVHSYCNPSHKHAEGGCCDVTVVGFILFIPIFGCGDCDNYFLFCLRTPGAAQDCPLGELHSGEVGGDSLTFNPGVGGSFGHLSNPLHFTNTGNWTGTFQLVIEVNDNDDIFPATLNGDEFVDILTITRSLAVGDSFTGEETFLGENERGTIVLSFQVVCTGHFYGPDCGTLCVPQDSSRGHYTCDSEGNRVCLDGYQDPTSNCTQCLPSGGCSAVGGYCREPYECFCHVGFTGEFCESVIDACVQVNPCQNGGSCEIDALGNLSCACALGFMGPSCETPTDESAPTSDTDETTPTDAPDDLIPSVPTDETAPTSDTDETTPTIETTPTDSETGETTPTDAPDDLIPSVPTDETAPTSDTDETTPTIETTPIDSETTATGETTPTDAPDDPILSVPTDETTPTDVPGDDPIPSDETPPTGVRDTGVSQPVIPSTPGSLDPTLLPGGRSNQRSSGGPGAGVLAAAVVVPLLVVLLSVAVIVTVVLVCQRRRRKWRFSGEVTTTLLDAADAQTSPPYAPRENPMYIHSTMGVVNMPNSGTSVDHEFDNPLYSEHSRTPLSASYASIHDNQFATSERPYVTDTLSSASSVDFKFDNPLYSKHNGSALSASYASIHDNPPLSASYVSIHDNPPATAERPYSTIDHGQRLHSASSAAPLVAGGYHSTSSTAPLVAGGRI